MTFYPTLEGRDFLNELSTPPGRPRNHITNPESGRLPFSCTLVVHKDLPSTMAFTARSLKASAGVKTIYDKDFQLDKIQATGNLLYGSRAMDGQTLITVQDSMETIAGEDGLGIIDSWAAVWWLISTGRTAVVDLSGLRPAGTIGSTGVEASGPDSFKEIYEAMLDYALDTTVLKLLKVMGVLNEVILRGGFKRGIVTSMMDMRCPYFQDYLNAPIAQLGGSHKKGAIVTPALLEDTELMGQVAEKVSSESMFLEKATDDGTYSNVCVGIKLADRATCLIWRNNLGRAMNRADVIDGMVQATKDVCALHVNWRNHPNAAANKDIWKPLEEDRQVAVDVLGLANLLSRFGYKYQDFILDLEAFVKQPYLATGTEQLRSDHSLNVCEWIYAAYVASTVAADAYMDARNLPRLDRLFTVEPAQSHSFELTDANGFTTARGIWPPMFRLTNRISNTQEDVLVDYGAAETIADIGPEWIFRLNNAWQQMMDLTGRAHAISMDTYEAPTQGWLAKWMRSDLKTVYYNFSGKYDQAYADKKVTEIDWDAEPEPECSVCAQ